MALLLAALIENQMIVAGEGHEGLQRPPCTYALLLTAFHPPRVHVHTYTHAHTPRWALAVSIRSLCSTGHPPVGVQNAHCSWQTAIFPARSLNKVFFSSLFQNLPRTCGRKVGFFTLEQMLGSEKKPSVSYGMSQKVIIRLEDCNEPKSTWTCLSQTKQKIILALYVKSPKLQFHLHQTNCLTFTFPFSTCLSPSLSTIREKTSDFHIITCYCHHISWFRLSQKKEADKMHFQCLHPKPKYTSSNHSNTQ